MEKADKSIWSHSFRLLWYLCFGHSGLFLFNFDSARYARSHVAFLGLLIEPYFRERKQSVIRKHRRSRKRFLNKRSEITKPIDCVCLCMANLRATLAAMAGKLCFLFFIVTLPFFLLLFMVTLMVNV